MYREKSKTTATLAHWPARLVPAAARENGCAECAASGERGFHVGGVARKDDADGKLAIVGGVRGVEGARSKIEADFAVQVEQPRGEFAMGGKALVIEGREGFAGSGSRSMSGCVLKTTSRWPIAARTRSE